MSLSEKENSVLHTSKWLQWLALPYLPKAWILGAQWTTMRLVLALAATALLYDGALLLYRGIDLRSEIGKLAETYDQEYSTVVVENGEVSVVGGPIRVSGEGTKDFIVDPDETIEESTITAPEYILVRRTTLIQKRPFDRRTYDVRDLQELVGEDRIEISGTSIGRVYREWGWWIALGTAFGLTAVMLPTNVIVGLLYSLAAGGLILAIRGKRLGHEFGVCFRCALVASTTVVVLKTLLSLAGTGLSCLGFVVWIAITTGMALWTVGKVPSKRPDGLADVFR